MDYQRVVLHKFDFLTIIAEAKNVYRGTKWQVSSRTSNPENTAKSCSECDRNCEESGKSRPESAKSSRELTWFRIALLLVLHAGGSLRRLRARRSFRLQRCSIATSCRLCPQTPCYSGADCIWLSCLGILLFPCSCSQCTASSRRNLRIKQSRARLAFSCGSAQRLGSLLLICAVFPRESG